MCVGGGGGVWVVDFYMCKHHALRALELDCLFGKITYVEQVQSIN